MLKFSWQTHQIYISSIMHLNLAVHYKDSKIEVWLSNGLIEEKKKLGGSQSFNDWEQISAACYLKSKSDNLWCTSGITK